MQQNQRARLVLGPFTLVLVLLVFGLIAGIGIAHYRNRATSAASAGSGSASSAASAAGILISSSNLDFGEVLVNGKVARQLMLRTTGSSAVKIHIEGTSAFQVDPETLTIEPGRVARVTVTANPTVVGSFKDELRIFADGASKAPMVVFLQGNARATHDMIAQGDLSGPKGAIEEAGSRVAPGTGTTGADAAGVTGAQDATGAASGSVQITRSTADGGDGPAGEEVDANGIRRGPGQTPGMVVVPYDPSQAHRTISDRANVPSSDTPPREGEQPAPVRGAKKPADLDPTQKDPAEPTPAVPTFVVSQTSTLTALGSKNQFYPQQLGVMGSGSGGPFSLASSLQLPRVPIAFGQTMVFTQTGAPSGAFDPSSGQVTLQLEIEAVDPNGNAAPFSVQMTTGSVVTRNNNGVLIQLTGQPRSPDSGVLRLVGIQKIPTGFRNSAEEQFVLVEIWASLNFPVPHSSDTSGSGN